MPAFSGRAMVICFNATDEAHKALQTLLSSGRYPDINAAVSAALCNQATLDAAVTAAGGMVIDKDRSPRATAPLPTVSPSRSDLPRLLQKPVPPFDTARFEIPAVTAEHPKELLGPREWSWGQFNKLLPIKVTCRATLNLLLQNPAIKPTEAAETIAKSAAELGKILRAADESSHRRRDEAFASALPGDDSEKGRQRFAEQFVFATGAFAETSYPQLLGLIRLVDGCVRLTPAGRAFGESTNPLFDGNLRQSAERFAEDELNFLRAHIKAHVPAERSALTAILQAVHNGARNPEAVDSYLRQLFPRTEPELSEGFLSTQRTGAISRAIELKLLRRERQGVRVTYLIEEAGEAFLRH